MQEQLLSNNGSLKGEYHNSTTVVKSTNSTPHSSEKIVSPPNVKNGTTPFTSIYVDADLFKNYLLLQRRALLQSVAADERFMGEIEGILHQIETIIVAVKNSLTNEDSSSYNQNSKPISVNGMKFDNFSILEIFKKCITMLKHNTEERRKAYLQIVRDTEKRYNLNNPKKRGRFNRQGV